MKLFRLARKSNKDFINIDDDDMHHTLKLQMKKFKEGQSIEEEYS